jgi:transcriptional regulator
LHGSNGKRFAKTREQEGDTMKKKGRELAAMIAEIEALAKRVRGELRRAARNTALIKTLEQAVAMLRKRAAQIAEMVEQYVHQLRVELAKGTMPGKAPLRRKRAA